MYALPAYMPSNYDVKPVGVMYNLPSYHKAIGEADNNVVDEVLDPVQQIEKKQKELIDALNGISDQLNTLLKTKGKSSPADKKVNNKTTVKAEAAATSSAPTENESKKGKEAKKEARKAAKADAKNKVASEAESNKSNALKPKAGNQKQWTIIEDKLSTETGQSLTACLQPTLINFPVNGFALGEAELSVTMSDLLWVRALASLGELRSVAFGGEVKNAPKVANSTVNVTLSEKFSFSVNEQKLTCRIAVWKLMGQVLGLFSYDSKQSIQAAHQHQWLLKANSVLMGKSNVADVVREASRYLSRFDTLGSQFNVCLADIITCSLLPESSLPNNVELWKKRVQVSCPRV